MAACIVLHMLYEFWLYRVIVGWGGGARRCLLRIYCNNVLSVMRIFGGIEDSVVYFGGGPIRYV